MLDPVNLIAGIFRDLRLKYKEWEANNFFLQALKLIMETLKKNN